MDDDRSKQRSMMSNFILVDTNKRQLTEKELRQKELNAARQAKFRQKKKAENEQKTQSSPPTKKKRMESISSHAHASSSSGPAQYGPPDVHPQLPQIPELEEPSASCLEGPPPGSFPAAAVESSQGIPIDELPEEGHEPEPPADTLASPVAEEPIRVFPTNPSSISSLAPETRWPGGVVTKLPWIDQTKKIRGKRTIVNAVPQDEAYVRQLSEGAFPASACPYVATVDRGDYTDLELATYVAEKWSRGIMVIVNNYETKRVPLTAEALEQDLGLVMGTLASVHSASRRAKGQTLIARQSYANFIEQVKSPTRIECILHCPDAFGNVTEFIAKLDQGIQAFNNMGKEEHDRSMPADIARARSWNLLHAALFHTYPHHDAGGLATWTVVYSGVKLWIVIVPKKHLKARSLEEHTENLDPFMAHEKKRGAYWKSTIAEDCDRYVVVAHPGTLILQPPHTPHEVYTPTESVTRGGHLVLYDSLHFTALARLFDHKTNGTVTNANHDFHYEMFVDMLRHIPEDQTRVHRRKPLAALCAIVLNPAIYCELWSPEELSTKSARYVDKLKRTPVATRYDRLYTVTLTPATEDLYPSYNHQAALQVAHALIDKLSLEIDDEGAYLFAGESWMDPGEEVAAWESTRRLSSMFVNSKK